MKYVRNRAPLLVIILIALIFPLIADSSDVAIQVLLVTGASAAWNIFSGYTGYISLGQATYYGLGAYTLTLASQDWHMQGGYELFLLLPLAGLVAGVFSLPLGWMALRTRRYTFMVITIAIFFIFQLLGENLGGITGGSSGIFLPLPTWSADIANIPFYYMALVLVLLIIFVSWRLRRAQYGLVLLAIRDDEERVRGLGHRTERYKLGAYVLSAVFTGMIGALAIYFAGFINPSSAFDQTFDITIVTITFFGGIGSIWGPVVGGLLLEPLQAYLIQQFNATATSLNQILFGCFLLVVILLFPQGIVPSLHKRWLAWRSSHDKIGTGQVLLAPFKPGLASKTNGAPALQAAQVQTVFDQQLVLAIPDRPIEQFEPLYLPPDQQLVSPIPQRPVERFEPLYTPTVSGPLKSHRMKASRLVPMRGNDPVYVPERSVPPPISWRCPNCKIPFLLTGDTCYCRRCGLKRELGSLPSV